MTHDPHFTIRPMQLAELELALEWAAQEGWNPGLHDAPCFHAADPDGFLIGCLDGEPIASISVVAYGANFGFLGLYIVRPEYRGQGYGWKLWQAGMARLGKRLVGLDGVVAQQDNYRKSGFVLAYRNVRYEGVGGGVVPSGLIRLSALDFKLLLDYDSRVFPAPRSRFLQAWISQPGAAAFGVLDGTRLSGYGLVRPCRLGWKIGPLFGDTAEIAECLFQGLSAHAAGASLFLDVPEINQAAVALAERHGMRRVFETARMYTGSAPALQTERIFGVTTFELG